MSFSLDVVGGLFQDLLSSPEGSLKALEQAGRGRQFLQRCLGAWAPPVSP